LKQPGLFDNVYRGLLDAPLAVIDLETTGTSATRDRIIEIGLVLLDNGRETGRFSTLVNPEVRLSEFIENYTGISTAMLRDAPRFATIARKLLEQLQGRILVAHNARFDYGFLRAEYARLGYNFSARTLCTVLLSRRLFPNERRHNLDSIIARHNLSCPSRHRALDDAAVLVDFLDVLRREIPAAKLDEAVGRQLGATGLPEDVALPGKAEPPQTPGVYRFYDSDDRLLYVGKSVNLRQRILSHFTGAHRHHKGLRMVRQIRRIDWTETAGELGALLLEARQIKDRQPLFNRQLRRHRGLFSLQLAPEPGSKPVIVSLDRPTDHRLRHCHGLFRSRKKAQETLRQLMRDQGLCGVLLGLEKTDGACFGYQLRQCRGACVGAEPVEEHHRRLQAALEQTRLTAWPWDGPVVIHERHPQSGLSARHLIDLWCHLETTTGDTPPASPVPESYRFDLDIYRILQTYLADNRQRLDIRPWAEKA